MKLDTLIFAAIMVGTVAFIMLTVNSVYPAY